jgi:hypothetical protein
MESATLTVHDDLRFRQSVALNGRGVRAATVAPSQINFGLRKVGTTSPARQVRVTNNLGAPLSLTSVTTVGDFVVAGNSCGSVIPPHSICNIGVAFMPAAVGARGGNLTIVDGASSIPLTVSLSGLGTETAAARARRNARRRVSRR